MAISLKSSEADQLARALAKHTGRSITDAVIYALREQLRREQGRPNVPDLAEEIMSIARRCSALPDVDNRSPDEILGYDERGLWS